MNSYHTGKLGLMDGVGLVFWLVIPRLFLSTISNLVQENGQILWLAEVIYTVIPLLVFFMMVYVCKYVTGDIFIVFQKLVGKLGAWFILLTYSVMFLSNSALTLRLYAEYTLLTALPQVEFQLVIIWYVITVGVTCYLGIEALTRTGYIVFPFLLGGLVLILLMLIPFYIGYNLTPWQGYGIFRGITSGVNGAGYNFGVLSLIFLAPAFQNAQTIKKAALYALCGAGALRISFSLVYIMVFGVLGSEKTMPLFELARLVYLNQYIQRIEALFIIGWVILGLLAVTGGLYVALYLIAILLKLPTLRPIVPLGALIVGNLAMLPPDIGYTLKVDQYLLTVLNIGIYVFPTLLFSMALWKRRRKGCTSV